MVNLYILLLYFIGKLRANIPNESLVYEEILELNNDVVTSANECYASPTNVHMQKCAAYETVEL